MDDERTLPILDALAEVQVTSGYRRPVPRDARAEALSWARSPHGPGPVEAVADAFLKIGHPE